MVGVFKSQKRSVAKFYAEGAIFGFLAATGVWLLLYLVFWLDRFAGGDADLSGGGVHIDLVPFAIKLPQLILFFVPAGAVSRLVVAVFRDKRFGYGSWLKSGFLTVIVIYVLVVATGLTEWLLVTKGTLAAHLRDSADPALWLASVVVLMLLALMFGALERFFRGVQT